jgi:D-alanyl-D-alanine carboxypeptidase/D-alanyl-D-alanine-endopeptidase (penicillin-binding protein 4)
MTRAAALLALALAASHALARELPAPVAAALARARVPAASVAIVVEPVEGGAPAIFHNARAPMNMASVMKVVTTYAALDLLGPAFSFRTDVLAAGEIRNGILEGNLVLRGGGDPKLTYERLWQLAHQLRARGLREIRGDIVIDRTYFAAQPHDPARFDNDPRRAYNVGPDALLVNFQVVNFTFIPVGPGVRVTGEPDLPNVEIASAIALTPEACGAWRRNLRHDVHANGLATTVTFTGSYPADCGERSWPLAVLDGPRFTEATLRWVWSEAGGVLRGRVREGTAPDDAKLFYRQVSEPVANLVRDMNKHSNNVVARHLFLALSAERGAPGEAAASARVVAEWLQARAIEAPELVLENGSGLSRDERASAATIAALLRRAWASPVMPELAASLPIFAVDGTLKSRRPEGAAGHAHLKGGTLTDVQSIAGYVLDRRGRRWVVVMAVNHAAAGAAQPALDALVEWVHRDASSKRGRP